MRSLSVATLLFLTSFNSFSQVKDVSFIFSPTMEYTWWDKDINIDDAPMYGGKLGFGFGPLFELRAFYLRGNNIKSTTRELTWKANPKWADNLRENEVDIYRYGGEMKLNLWKNAFFTPYLTAGAGVQELKYNGFLSDGSKADKRMKDEQLFVALGVGAKMNLSHRAVLSLEAKNTMFNVGEGRYFMRPEYNNEDGGNHMYNWTAAATLDFYLGGQDERYDAISREYRKLFSGGFKGVKFVAEPGVAYLDFDKDMPMTDTYLLGGSAGFDFSPLVGIRGFYYQATEDADKLSLSFNKNLALYGGNLITRLNFPRGVNPYLQLGGGYMKVGDKYEDKHGSKAAESSAFAFGGAGIEIPISKYVALFGVVNAMFTTEKGIEEENIQNTDHINTSILYNAGLRFNIGQAANGEKKYKRYLNRELSEQREASNERLNNMRAEYNEKISDYDERIEDYNEKIDQYDEQLAQYEKRVNDLKAEYEKRINKLDRELDMALQAKDTIKVTQIIREKERREQDLRQVEDDELAVKQKLTTDIKPGRKTVRLTTSELEELVRKVTEEAKREDYYTAPQTRSAVPQDSPDGLKLELRLLNEKLDRMISGQAIQSATRLAPAQGSYEAPATTLTPTMPVVQDKKVVAQDVNGNSRRLKVNRLAVLTGFGFGDLSAWNLGVRGYMQIGTTKLDFAPEIYTAFASKSGIGLAANVLYNIQLNQGSKITPYVGLGVGLFHGDKSHFGSNIILGASAGLGNGKVFAEYSARSLAKQNQLAVGYSFIF